MANATYVDVGARNLMSYVLSVLSEYTRTPGPRYKHQGAFSGEQFRDDVLVRRLQDGGAIVVDLDGTAGYGSSFIDEAFGGLVRLSRKFGFSKDDLIRRVTFKSDEDPSFRIEAERAMRQARPE